MQVENGQKWYDRIHFACFNSILISNIEVKGMV